MSERCARVLPRNSGPHPWRLAVDPLEFAAG